MPAPAVIPALIAYVKVVAVKTLVVGLRSSEARLGTRGLCPRKRAAPGFWVGWAAVNSVQWRVAAPATAYRAFGVGSSVFRDRVLPVGLALGTIYHD